MSNPNLKLRALTNNNEIFYAETLGVSFNLNGLNATLQAQVAQVLDAFISRNRSERA
jgi:hypothetical protein